MTTNAELTQSIRQWVEDAVTAGASKTTLISVLLSEAALIFCVEEDQGKRIGKPDFVAVSQFAYATVRTAIALVQRKEAN